MVGSHVLIALGVAAGLAVRDGEHLARIQPLGWAQAWFSVFAVSLGIAVRTEAISIHGGVRHKDGSPMVVVTKSKRFETPADQLWARVGGWGTIHEWHPAVASTDVTDEGARRTLKLGDGGVIVERLLEQTDDSYSYAFEESPLPVEEYSATIRVRPEGSGSIMTWEGRFKPVGVEEAEAVAVIGGIYQAGLDAL